MRVRDGANSHALLYKIYSRLNPMKQQTELIEGALFLFKLDSK